MHAQICLCLHRTLFHTTPTSLGRTPSYNPPAHSGKPTWFFYKHAIKVGRAWMKRHKLPDHNHDQWASFLVDQWDLHSKHLASTTALSSQEVRQLCTTTSHLVRLPADHHPHRVHLTCSLHFFALLDRTFANGTVFPVCHPQPLDELLSELKRAVPTNLRKAYAWGFNWKRTTPYAYILPKESKLWQAA